MESAFEDSGPIVGGVGFAVRGLHYDRADRPLESRGAGREEVKIADCLRTRHVGTLFLDTSLAVDVPLA
jgi:hypothetical protein